MTQARRLRATPARRLALATAGALAVSCASGLIHPAAAQSIAEPGATYRVEVVAISRHLHGCGHRGPYYGAVRLRGIDGDAAMGTLDVLVHCARTGGRHSHPNALRVGRRYDVLLDDAVTTTSSAETRGRRNVIDTLDAFELPRFFVEEHPRGVSEE